MGRKKSWKKPKYPRSSRQDSQIEQNDTHYDPTVFAEVESLFKKQFTFNTPQVNSSGDGSWALPPVDQLFSGEPWEVAELTERREKLNEVKASLSDFDINQWHEHTQFTNRAGSVIQHVRRTRKPELCTQAWCKFHEIVASFPILPPGVRRVVAPPGDDPKPAEGASVPTLEEEGVLRSVHMCEAPGAFIASLNHYLKTRAYNGEWHWMANTLNPYYEGNDLSEMIADDRLILDTLDQWYFGPDDTGDIMNKENIKGLQERTGQMGPVHLVTCDGSIDCQNRPGDQESVVAPLHYCEVTASLLLLSPGGSLVLKMFTLFEGSSVCLMYLLNIVFTKVHVFKPATSKSGNSELYVVCLGFKGCDKTVTDKLLQVTGKSLPPAPMFQREDIPESFIVEHSRCCQLFMKFQTQTIEENLSMFRSMSADRTSHLTAVRQYCATCFVDRYQIRPLPAQSFIVPPFQMVGGSGWSKSHVTRSRKCHTGSYSDRQSLLQLPWNEQLRQVQLYEVSSPNLGWLQGDADLDQEDLSSWPVTCGPTPPHVLSSQFCESVILQFYNQLLTHHQVKQRSIPDFSELSQALESICTTPMDEGDGQPRVTVIQLDKEQGPLVKYLSQSEGFQVGTSESIEDQINRVLVSEVGAGEDLGCNWIANNQEVVRTLSTLFQTIQPGDHCVFLLPDLLTRFSAGLFYVLFAAFEEVCVSLTHHDAMSPVAVIGQRCRCNDQQGVMSWLTRVVETLGSQTGASQNVLQITPIHILFESVYYRYLCSTNETLLKVRSNTMIQQQRQEIGIGQ